MDQETPEAHPMNPTDNMIEAQLTIDPIMGLEIQEEDSMMLRGNMREALDLPSIMDSEKEKVPHLSHTDKERGVLLLHTITTLPSETTEKKTDERDINMGAIQNQDITDLF